MMVSVTASAQTAKRIPLPPSQNPTGRDLPISAAAWAGNTLYVSGWLDPDMKADTDTKSQTVGIPFKDIQKLLESQGLTMGDVAMVRVFLGYNPATNGKPDFDGMMAGYTQFFGTKDQTEQASARHDAASFTLPAASRGALIEIDLVAQRPCAQRTSDHSDPTQHGEDRDRAVRARGDFPRELIVLELIPANRRCVIRVGERGPVDMKGDRSLGRIDRVPSEVRAHAERGVPVLLGRALGPIAGREFGVRASPRDEICTE